METNEQIVDETLANRSLVGRTEIRDAPGVRAVLEYPIKTMNVLKKPMRYQVDTGPVAFPDLSKRHQRQVDGISLAFVAFNAPHFADFVLEAPTRLGDAETASEIHHYSKLLALPAVNRLFAVD